MTSCFTENVYHDSYDGEVDWLILIVWWRAIISNKQCMCSLKLFELRTLAITLCISMTSWEYKFIFNAIKLCSDWFLLLTVSNWAFVMHCQMLTFKARSYIDNDPQRISLRALQWPCTKYCHKTWNVLKSMQTMNISFD